MKKLAAVVAILIISGVSFAQAPVAQASKYQPNETQTLKLKLAQDEAKIAQSTVQTLNSQLQAAQTAFTDKIKDLSAQCEAVKKENGWPVGVVCDFDKLTFAEVPKAEPAKAEAKEAPKTETKPTPSK